VKKKIEIRKTSQAAARQEQRQKGQDDEALFLPEDPEADLRELPTDPEALEVTKLARWHGERTRPTR